MQKALHDSRDAAKEEQDKKVCRNNNIETTTLSCIQCQRAMHHWQLKYLLPETRDFVSSSCLG